MPGRREEAAEPTPGRRVFFRASAAAAAGRKSGPVAE